MKIELNPIGVIHSPWNSRQEAPPQSNEITGIKAEIEIFESYAPGLKDLEDFSHIILLYYLHQNSSYKLQIFPRDHNQLRGLFATRSPHRPNSIGISIVRLHKIENNILHTSNIDAIDGTPLLDIKPYIPDLDFRQKVKTGWSRER